MKDVTRLFAVLVLSACVLVVSGCRSERSTDDPATSEKPVETAAAADAAGNDAGNDGEEAGMVRRRATAARAKDALFAALSGRLKEVLQADGPAAAIEVCSQEANQIARRVGEEHGVEIGRTSFKLRNPDNAPRAWVQPLVEQRVEQPHYRTLEDGRLGAVFPIRLDVKCLMCHGGPDDLVDQVRPELAKRYPNDEATGFQAGDLRGWFWVEVPEAG